MLFTVHEFDTMAFANKKEQTFTVPVILVGEEDNYFLVASIHFRPIISYKKMFFYEIIGLK